MVAGGLERTLSFGGYREASVKEARELRGRAGTIPLPEFDLPL
jgi:hypothetical protein